MGPSDPEKQFYFQWHFIERCNLRTLFARQKEFFNN